MIRKIIAFESQVSLIHSKIVRKSRLMAWFPGGF